MSGILERFFQVALLLTLILLAMNLSIAVFGEAMTGERFTVEGNILSGISTTLTTNIVEQKDAAISKPSQDDSTWEAILTQVQTLTIGYQAVFDRIFDTVGLGVIGDFLIGIITILQIVGIAYLFWALISAVTGGGSP